MPLTPEEQAELQQLEAQFGNNAVASVQPQTGLNPSEQAELQQLEAQYGQEPIKQSFPEKISDLASMALQGASFGYSDELVGKLAGEEAMLKERERLSRTQERHPYLSTGAEISGSLLTPAGGIKLLGRGGQAISKGIGKYASGSKASAIGAGAGLGATSGALYGSGISEEGERLGGAISGGVLGGVGGGAGTAIIQKAPILAGSLRERALRLMGKDKAPPSVQPLQVKTPKQAIEQQTGEILPLTRGQSVQSQEAQALEGMARAGALDDVAKAKIGEVDFAQQEAIKQALGDADEQALETVGKTLKSSYKGLKSQVGKAYDDAETIRKVVVDKKPIVAGLVPKINDIMYKKGFDASNLTAETSKLLKQATGGSLKDVKVSGINLEKMEFWRRKLTNRANSLRGDPEGVMIKNVVKEYDRFMGKLPAEALKSGDETALKAIDNARSLRRRQGVLFERDKIVKNIVKNDELTNEELANIVLSGSGRSGAVNTGSGRTVKAMKRAVGDKAPELASNLKKGVMGRVLEKSMINTMREGTDIQMVSPNKLLKELDTLTKNKSFIKEVFDADSLKTVNALRNDLRKITSQQSGTANYSNTAYTLLNALKRLPFGLSSIGGVAELAIKPVGDKMARDKLMKSLSGNLNDAKKELIGTRKLYTGAVAGERTIGGND